MIANRYGTVPRDPDLVGTVGRAWRIPLAPLGQRGTPDADGTVAGWLAYVPGAHLLWSYWAITVIHLRPIAGVRPATITVHGATHEIVVLAINPEQPLPDLDAVGRGHAAFAYLTPIDVVEQFTVANDAQAAELGELVVRACIDGIASPDQDWRSWWRQSIPATAAHLRDGHHPELTQ